MSPEIFQITSGYDYHFIQLIKKFENDCKLSLFSKDAGAVWRWDVLQHTCGCNFRSLLFFCWKHDKLGLYIYLDFRNYVENNSNYFL